MREITLINLSPKQITVLESKRGLQGPKGDAGPPGAAAAGADLHTSFAQGTASAIWTVNHGLGKRPSVTIFDSAGDQVEGHVSHIDANNLTIAFSAAFAGTAFFN